MESRSILLVFSLLVAAAATAQEAYRWVDEDGIVHYSDRPEDGAEAILLPRPNVATTRPLRQPEAQPQEEQTDEAAATRYESIEIVSPSAEETLWNLEGVLNVTVALKPALQPGHQLRVYFDGQMQSASGTSFQLQEVWRGVHNIQVEVVDGTGKLMIRSRTNRFYVQQNTVKF